MIGDPGDPIRGSSKQSAPGFCCHASSTGYPSSVRLIEVMDQVSLTQNPFAVLTFIAAPALLANASDVLALNTINRPDPDGAGTGS